MDSNKMELSHLNSSKRKILQYGFYLFQLQIYKIVELGFNVSAENFLKKKCTSVNKYLI